MNKLKEIKKFKKVVSTEVARGLAFASSRGPMFG